MKFGTMPRYSPVSPSCFIIFLNRPSIESAFAPETNKIQYIQEQINKQIQYIQEQMQTTCNPIHTRKDNQMGKILQSEGKKYPVSGLHSYMDYYNLNYSISHNHCFHSSRSYGQASRNNKVLP